MNKDLVVFISLAAALTAGLAVLDHKVLLKNFPSLVAVPVAYGVAGGVGFLALSSLGIKPAAQAVLASCTSAAASALATRAIGTNAPVILPEYKV